MSFSLKPRVFLIGFLPGFLFVFMCLILYKKYDLHAIKVFAEHISLFSGIAIVILSFIVGQIFDSIRDFLIEEILFKYLSQKRFYKKCFNNGDINWDFFHESTEVEIDKLDNNYYLFYVVNMNLLICLLIVSIFVIANWPNEIPKEFIINKCWQLVVIFGSILFLFLDALVLRDEVAKITKKNNGKNISS